MTFREMADPPVLSRTDVKDSLAELALARQRQYFDADADSAAADLYYRDTGPGEFGDLVRRTHVRTPTYKPARELYPWVDLQPGGMIRSLYTGQDYEAEDFILADLEVTAARSQELRTRLSGLRTESDAELTAELEAALPYNCEHVVPQSWFARKEPMRGDLHHLFACESRCNSFRSNTPFAEFADFPELAVGETPGMEIVRSDCGKSEANGFEPAHGKGAAARAVFYFLLRYPTAVQDTEMPPGRREMVLAWDEQDPVGEWERHRNAAIFERQGNRNPFIDFPQLAGDLLRTVGS